MIDIRDLGRAALAMAGLVLLVAAAPAWAGSTERVSVSSSGKQANGGSGSAIPMISADGRFVAFTSGASNLVPGDTNGSYDVFVRDRLKGTTERVSVGPHGLQGNGDSGGRNAALSADGRFVAFDSFATNLVPGGTNGERGVFVRDRVKGATTQASVSSRGKQGNGASPNNSPGRWCDWPVVTRSTSNRGAAGAIVGVGRWRGMGSVGARRPAI